MFYVSPFTNANVIHPKNIYTINRIMVSFDNGFWEKLVVAFHDMRIFLAFAQGGLSMLIMEYLCYLPYL